mmetsp:Transcript_12821/g.31963  ORF Transcript_12821/g.31963 Transcript_12821/m.31963 type:complete len:201 (+) Transcript_12821:55-657(+)
MPRIIQAPQQNRDPANGTLVEMRSRHHAVVACCRFALRTCRALWRPRGPSCTTRFEGCRITTWPPATPPLNLLALHLRKHVVCRSIRVNLRKHGSKILVELCSPGLQCRREQLLHVAAGAFNAFYPPLLVANLLELGVDVILGHPHEPWKLLGFRSLRKILRELLAEGSGLSHSSGITFHPSNFRPTHQLGHRVAHDDAN